MPEYFELEAEDPGYGDDKILDIFDVFLVPEYKSGPIFIPHVVFRFYKPFLDFQENKRYTSGSKASFDNFSHGSDSRKYGWTAGVKLVRETSVSTHALGMVDHYEGVYKFGDNNADWVSWLHERPWHGQYRGVSANMFYQNNPWEGRFCLMLPPLEVLNTTNNAYDGSDERITAIFQVQIWDGHAFYGRETIRGVATSMHDALYKYGFPPALTMAKHVAGETSLMDGATVFTREQYFNDIGVWKSAYDAIKTKENKLSDTSQFTDYVGKRRRILSTMDKTLQCRLLRDVKLNPDPYEMGNIVLTGHFPSLIDGKAHAVKPSTTDGVDDPTHFIKNYFPDFSTVLSDFSTEGSGKRIQMCLSSGFSKCKGFNLSEYQVKDIPYELSAEESSKVSSKVWGKQYFLPMYGDPLSEDPHQGLDVSNSHGQAYNDMRGVARYISLQHQNEYTYPVQFSHYPGYMYWDTALSNFDINYWIIDNKAYSLDYLYSFSLPQQQENVAPFAYRRYMYDAVLQGDKNAAADERKLGPSLQSYYYMTNNSYSLTYSSRRSPNFYAQPIHVYNGLSSTTISSTPTIASVLSSEASRNIKGVSALKSIVTVQTFLDESKNVIEKNAYFSLPADGIDNEFRNYSLNKTALSYPPVASKLFSQYSTVDVSLLSVGRHNGGVIKTRTQSFKGVPLFDIFFMFPYERLMVNGVEKVRFGMFFRHKLSRFPSTLGNLNSVDNVCVWDPETENDLYDAEGNTAPNALSDLRTTEYISNPSLNAAVVLFPSKDWAGKEFGVVTLPEGGEEDFKVNFPTTNGTIGLGFFSDSHPPDGSYEDPYYYSATPNEMIGPFTRALKSMGNKGSEWDMSGAHSIFYFRDYKNAYDDDKVWVKASNLSKQGYLKLFSAPTMTLDRILESGGQHKAIVSLDLTGQSYHNDVFAIILFKHSNAQPLPMSDFNAWEIIDVRWVNSSSNKSISEKAVVIPPGEVINLKAGIALNNRMMSEFSSTPALTLVSRPLPTVTDLSVSGYSVGADSLDLIKVSFTVNGTASGDTLSGLKIIKNGVEVQSFGAHKVPASFPTSKHTVYIKNNCKATDNFTVELSWQVGSSNAVNPITSESSVNPSLKDISLDSFISHVEFSSSLEREATATVDPRWNYLVVYHDELRTLFPDINAFKLAVIPSNATPVNASYENMNAVELRDGHQASLDLPVQKFKDTKTLIDLGSSTQLEDGFRNNLIVETLHMLLSVSHQNVFTNQLEVLTLEVSPGILDGASIKLTDSHGYASGYVWANPFELRPKRVYGVNLLPKQIVDNTMHFDAMVSDDTPSDVNELIDWKGMAESEGASSYVSDSPISIGSGNAVKTTLPITAEFTQNTDKIWIKLRIIYAFAAWQAEFSSEKLSAEDFPETSRAKDINQIDLGPLDDNNLREVTLRIPPKSISKIPFDRFILYTGTSANSLTKSIYSADYNSAGDTLLTAKFNEAVKTYFLPVASLKDGTAIDNIVPARASDFYEKASDFARDDETINFVESEIPLVAEAFGAPSSIILTADIPASNTRTDNTGFKVLAIDKTKAAVIAGGDLTTGAYEITPNEIAIKLVAGGKRVVFDLPFELKPAIYYMVYITYSAQPDTSAIVSDYEFILPERTDKVKIDSIEAINTVGEKLTLKVTMSHDNVGEEKPADSKFVLVYRSKADSSLFLQAGSSMLSLPD